MFVFSTVPPCDNIADIGFVVDSSGSLRRSFGKEKDFVKILADGFGISRDGSRAGIVTFSYNAVLTAKMSDHQNMKDFRASVDKIPYMGYTTRIDKALKVARDELFVKSNGARAGVPKILFILTDGSQTKDKDAVNPAGIAAEMREKLGVVIFVIGIGRNVVPLELNEIAGGIPSRMFLAKDFNELLSSVFVAGISKAYCQKGSYSVIFLCTCINAMLSFPSNLWVR